jgi:hypothetical protein
MPWQRDPLDDEDLASDIAFGAWLESLDPEEVRRNSVPVLRGIEKSTLDYMRRRLLTSEHRSRSKPPPT